MAWSGWSPFVQVMAPARATGDRHERALPGPQRKCGLGRLTPRSQLAGKLIRYDQVIDQGQQLGKLRTLVAFQVRHDRDAGLPRHARCTNHPLHSEMIDKEHARCPDNFCMRPLRLDTADIFQVVKDRSCLLTLINDHRRMDRPGAGLPVDVLDIHAFVLKVLQHVFGQFVVSQRAGVSAGRPETGGCNQGRAGQPAALPLAAANLHLRVRGGVGIDIEQIIDGDAAQAQNVVTRSHGLQARQPAAHVQRIFLKHE